MDIATVATIFSAIVSFYAACQHLKDKLAEKRRELADILATHLDTISTLYGEAANALENLDEPTAASVCNKLRIEVNMLDRNVLSKILEEDRVVELLTTAENAVKVEEATRQLIGEPPGTVKPFVNMLNETRNLFHSLAYEVRLRGTV